MKHFTYLITTFFLLVFSFTSCTTTESEKLPPLGLFEIQERSQISKNPPIPNWSTKNADGNYIFYMYIITKAPEEYSQYVNSTVYYPISQNNVGNMWHKSVKDLILLSLDYDDFHTFIMDNQSYICTSLNLNEKPYKHIDKAAVFLKEKNDIYKILKLKYAGYPDMVKRGFTKEMWDNASTFDEIKDIFDTCINDTHLSISTNSGFYYHQNQRFDEGTSPSIDPEKTFIAKKTSNTYYIRYNSCDVKWPDYANFPKLAYEAKNKDYIVLDFRSNHGGGNYQQILFFRNLADYKGTIYVLQDNWSYSSGEAWETTGEFIDKLNLKLVGTHSGGMQLYGNCRSITKGDVTAWVPSSSFAALIPKNYLGEGLGYEPDIWATTPQMKQVLESQGLDLSGIIFQ